MSVLEDIAPVKAGWARDVASRTSSKDAREIITMLMKVADFEFSGAEYSLDAGDVPGVAMDQACAHWETEDGKIHWGIPATTGKKFYEDILADERYWDDGVYSPPTERKQSEKLARRDTLASHLLPFKSGRANTDPGVTRVLVPILNSARTKEVICGSKAVATLIRDVGKRTGWYKPATQTSKYSTGGKVNYMKDLIGYGLFLSYYTGVNIGDAPSAYRRSQHLDEYRLAKSIDYTCLADFANVLDACRKGSRQHGFIGKKMRSLLEKINVCEMGINDQLDRGKKASFHETDYLEYLVEEPERIFHSVYGGKNITPVYKTSRSPDIRVAGTRGMVLVTIAPTGVVLCLTEEDIKSLKFASMTHSLWNYYAASIPFEYAPVEKTRPTLDREEEIVDDSREGRQDAVLSAASQISKETMRIAEALAPSAFRESSDDIVGLTEVMYGIEDLWKFYLGVVEKTIIDDSTDYAGRYMHEMFAVFKSSTTGPLSSMGYENQKLEFLRKWRERGFRATSDLARFEEIMIALPMTEQEDFGRLAKIVFPFDSCLATAYCKRASDMQVPNPIGRTTFTGEYEHEVHPFTEIENKNREARFKCGLTVLIALTDLRVSSAAGLSSEDREHLDGLGWVDVVTWMRKNKKNMKCKAGILNKPWCDVPRSLYENAKNQAKKLKHEGRMPTEPYAGAFIDIEDLIVYKERGNPDISLIKATAIPPTKLREALSTTSRAMKNTTTRDTAGQRREKKGTMIDEFLHGRFPSREESIEAVKYSDQLFTTSIKIETNKDPTKNRIITSGEANARRYMSETEFNIGRFARHMVGYMVGVDQASLKNKMYASIRSDLAPGRSRVMVSADLSNFSTGMREDIQRWGNEVWAKSFDGGTDMFLDLIKATTNSHMIMANRGYFFYFRNKCTANYEGLDGKRNTTIHCTLWYLARCDAFKMGVTGTMRPFVYIDDVAYVIETEASKVHETARILRQCAFSIYTTYGFVLSLFKTICSTNYVQFLNEIYRSGIAVGYGFRALCHTGAQSFPKCATVAEEIAVITSGMRGASVAGGHGLRVLAGMHFLLVLYTWGVIGSSGQSLSGNSAMVFAVSLYLPTIAGGFGVPNSIGLLSNLSGNRDVEKLDRVARMAEFAVSQSANFRDGILAHMKAHLTMPVSIGIDDFPDRMTIAHPSTSMIGAKGRDLDIAKGAAKNATDDTAIHLLEGYIDGFGQVASFTKAFVIAAREIDCKIPPVILEDALSADPETAVTTLVGKIASSCYIDHYVDRSVMYSYVRKYRHAGKTRIRDLAGACGEAM